jgi:hypothetical protein
MKAGRSALLGAVVGAALVAGSTAIAGSAATAAPQITPGLDSVTATLSNAHAGARPVAVTLVVHAEMQCGRLFGGALIVRLPSQERVPATVATAAVLVAGKPAGAVAVTGHTLTISLPRPRGVICDVIGPGTATVVLTRTANLGNPKAAGSYPLVVARGAEQFKTQLKIT